MKFFLAVVVLALVAAAQAQLTEEQKAKFQKAYDFCVAETKVDTGLIKKMRKNEFTEDSQLIAYVGCMFKKLGFMDAEGHIQGDVIKTKIPPGVDRGESEKIIEKCIKEHGTTPDMTAYVVYKCYRLSASQPIVI